MSDGKWIVLLCILVVLLNVLNEIRRERKWGKETSDE